MDANQEARSAFKLWQRLAEIESILWDRYYNEFMDLMIDNPSQSSLEHEQNDPIPF